MKFIANFVTNLTKYMYELNIQNCRPLGNIYLQASIKKPSQRKRIDDDAWFNMYIQCTCVHTKNLAWVPTMFIL